MEAVMKLGKLVFVCVFSWMLGMMLAKALIAADLPLPKKRPVSVQVIMQPEQCVAPGVKPSSGQVMFADQTCPSGLRWKFEK
jgi:hypothetical protein